MITNILIAHLLGDYFFQWDKLVIAKRKYKDALFYHCLIYAACCILIGVLYENIFWMILMSIAHFLIDFLFFIISDNKKGISLIESLVNKSATFLSKYLYHDNPQATVWKNKERDCFLLDQILHLISWVVLWFFIPPNTAILNDGFRLKVLAIMLVLKPTSVLIRKMIQKFRIEQSRSNSDGIAEAENTIEGAGSLIGYMERLIMMSSLLTGVEEYIVFSFGFVLTAKTISRYGKTSKDENFAQYFVIGTFFSIVLTVVAYLVYEKLMQIG